MAEVNKHGLPRDIPDPIKRQVRQKCGFGCVICGNAICQYHHFNPPYARATIHDPDKIVLLCLGCHGRVTSRLLSNDTVARAAKYPKCLEKNFSHFSMDMGDKELRVMLGNNSIVNVRSLIQVGEEKFFNMEPPEEPGGPIKLTAHFYDNLGNVLAQIVQNEWQGISTNWDIENVGPRLTVRRKQRDISLVIRASPPDGYTIEKLHMLHKGFDFSVLESGEFRVTGPKNPEGRQKTICLNCVNMENCGVGVHIPPVDSPMWMMFPPLGTEIVISAADLKIDGGNPWAFSGPPRAFKRRHKTL